ncbi:stonustoxin subunit beta-like [Pempheris klunzingeri]|uniref:stonustoxin subunit beta-like n=1 Tax=Pempheris klunzingeri TaxID=3127111 RepID=UPI003980F50F
MSSDVMEMPALGRPFILGMLYHALEHKLIPGVTLWDATTLEKRTVESSKQSSGFEIIASDSIQDKCFLLGVDASLKASFLSGLVEVEGSAKYLNDKKKFIHQSRVTLQYKATTAFKQLSLTHLETMDTQQMDVTETGLATHVVMGILYGANAFFVFDSEKLESTNIQSIQGSLEAVIKKIPDFDIEGKVDIKLSDEEKAMTDTFTCKFYGDFLLESNPSTFEKAVKTYVELPKLLGEKKENAVPLKVWLLPLKYFHSKTPPPMIEISAGLVRNIQDTLEDLHQLERRCNDFLEDKVAKLFPKIHEKLSTFKKLAVYYTSVLQKDIAKKLPLIRGGDEDESELGKIFEDQNKSPFRHDNLIQWIEDKEKEINIIKSCVDMMEGTKVIPSQSELDREVLAPGVEHALCFVFTSLETAEPYLKELANYVDPLKLQGTVGVAPSRQNHWYFSNEAVTSMREKAKDFHELTKALKNSQNFRFFQAAVANEKYKGASIYHYKEGILITENFSKPSSSANLPPVETIQDRSAIIWYACAPTLDPETAYGHLILSEGNKKVTYQTVWQSYPNHPQRFEHFPQVLCREGLTGRCYWEVEWSVGHSEDVAVGVSYKGIYRKGDGAECSLGCNDMSWCFGHRWSPPAATLYSEHSNEKRFFPVPSTGCNRLGVYLDWCGGTLSYYKVSANTLSHLHTFHTRFTEPVYPAFLIWRESNFVFLCL